MDDPELYEAIVEEIRGQREVEVQRAKPCNASQANSNASQANSKDSGASECAHADQPTQGASADATTDATTETAEAQKAKAMEEGMRRRRLQRQQRIPRTARRVSDCVNERYCSVLFYSVQL